MLKFKTIKEENECRKLWEKFSDKKLLWDLWDFRNCFHNSNFEFNFIVGIKSEDIVGIMPLVYDKIIECYTYFGDTFPEQNKFLIKDKKYLKEFLDNCPDETFIYYIDPKELKDDSFKEGERRFFLNLAKYDNNFDNYLKSFNKKHRKNLNYDLKKLEIAGYSIEVNNFDHFERLVELNKERFGKESDYSEAEFIKSINQLIDLTHKWDILDMISIKIGDKVEAVSLSVYYNHIYTVLSVGSNIHVKNIGKLLIGHQIKSAISHKCQEVDFMSTESGWKELWNLENVTMYEFEK